jgi:Fanconi anemia group M protein
MERFLQPSMDEEPCIEDLHTSTYGGDELGRQSTISSYIPEDKGERPMVCVDSREAASRNGKKIVQELGKLGAEVSVLKLDFGDYMVGEDVAIERKTVFDLAGTLTQRFLFDQIFKMRESYPRSLVIIEGYMGVLRKFRRISPESLNGALFALAQNGVPVVPTIDYKDTAIFLIVASKQLAKGTKQAPLIRHRAKTETTAERQLFLVAGLPHVGPILADGLLRFFSTPRKVFEASKEELMAVKDVGPKTAEDIVQVLETPYTPESEEKAREG